MTSESEHRDDLPPSAMARHLRDASRMVERTVGSNNLLAQAADHIERLHKDLIIALELKTTALRERDAARREVCGWASRHFKEYAEHIARERGWDCFKETAK